MINPPLANNVKSPVLVMMLVFKSSVEVLLTVKCILLLMVPLVFENSCVPVLVKYTSPIPPLLVVTLIVPPV